MPRSFAREHYVVPTYNVKEGEKFVVLFVPADKGGVRADLRVCVEGKTGKRIAFPNKWGTQPQLGEEWECQIGGENPQKSVYFLKLLRKVSDEASRQAAAEAERQAAKTAAQIWQDRKPVVLEALNAFGGFGQADPTISVPGYGDLPVRLVYEKSYATVDGVVHSYRVQAGVVKENLWATREGSHEVLVPWAEVQFERYNGGIMYMDFSTVFCSAKTPGQNLRIHVSELNPDWVQFVEWQLLPTEVKALVRASLPHGISQDFSISIGKFENGEVRWQYRGGLGPQAIDCVPEVGAEQTDHLQAVLSAYKQQGIATKEAGLLVVDLPVWYVLQRLQVGGIAWGGNISYSDGPIVHPDLVPFLERATWSGNPIKVRPLTLPEKWSEEVVTKAYEGITWPFGMPDMQQIAAILADTVEEVVPLSSEELDAWWRAQDTVSAEVSSVEANHYAGKFAFQATVEVPHRVFTIVNTGNPSFRILCGTREELRAIVIKDIAHGNEPWQGIVDAKPIQRHTRYGEDWSIEWTAPKTSEEEEKIERAALEHLVEYATRYQAHIIGWRYTDTGNPVVIVNFGDCWEIYELDRDTMTISYRKGAGSKACSFTERKKSVVNAALEKYRGFGWPVEPDKNLEFQSLKKFLEL